MVFICKGCRKPGAKLIQKGHRGVTGKFLVVKCYKRGCGYEHADRPQASRINSNIPEQILKAALNCMLGDIPYEIFESLLMSYRIHTPSRQTFHNIMAILCEDFNYLFKDLVKENRECVKNYYINVLKQKPVAGKINIAVSCDGSYTKRSYHKSKYDSQYCISYISESHTGDAIDFHVVENV